MYILDVIPLIAIPRNQDQILSYFFEEKLPAGSLVEVEIRKRKIKAVVLVSRSLAELKIKLKKEADFELKPISKVIREKPVLNQRQINIALWLSAKYFAPLGLCVKAVLPSFSLEKAGLRSDLESVKRSDLVAQKLILIPEKIMAEHFLEKYKEDKPVFISSSTKTKEYFKIWRKVQKGETGTVIGTRVALFLPFANLKEIIIEDESNIAYRSDYTPKYDTEVLARRVAKEHEAKLTIQDSLPKVETYYEFGESVLPKKIKTSISFADMVSEIKKANFSVFSRELQECLKPLNEQKKKAIIFVPRKGYAPYLLCQNCGHIPRCPSCDHVLTVHKSTLNLKLSTLNLICHHCQNVQPILNICPECKKSVLEYKGLGIEKAEEKLNKFFKDNGIKSPQILTLTADMKEKERENVVGQFKNLDSAIMLATQKVLSYKYPIPSPSGSYGTSLLKADLVGILNLESLLNFVDFRTEEEALRTVFNLSRMAEKTIIQGYDPEAKVVKTILSQDFKSFYEEELEARKEFNYPPFAELIKLTYHHRNQRMAEQEAEMLMERLKHGAGIRSYGKNIEIIGSNAGLKEGGLYTQEIVLKSKLEIKKRNELLRLISRNWKMLMF